MHALSGSTSKSRLGRLLQSEQAAATRYTNWTASLLPHLQLVDLLQDSTAITAVFFLHGAQPLLQGISQHALVFKVLCANGHLLSAPAVHNALSTVGRAATRFAVSRHCSVLFQLRCCISCSVDTAVVLTGEQLC